MKYEIAPNSTEIQANWDAANNISKEQVEEFIKLLQYQLNLDVVKPIIVEHKLDLPFEIADKSTEKELTWPEAFAYVESLGEGWRLPTIEELKEIYNSENDFVGSYYWSSPEGNGNYAWRQGMSNGFRTSRKYKGYSAYVRAVRSIDKQKSNVLPFEIADKSTERRLSWNEAVEYCETFGEGWRLPNKDELNQIYQLENDFTKKEHWSSTEFNSLYAWKQSFEFGIQDFTGKNYCFYVRAIKDL